MCDELYVCTDCGELGHIFVFFPGVCFLASFTLYITYSNSSLSNIIGYIKVLSFRFEGWNHGVSV